MVMELQIIPSPRPVPIYMKPKNEEYEVKPTGNLENFAKLETQSLKSDPKTLQDEESPLKTSTHFKEDSADSQSTFTQRNPLGDYDIKNEKEATCDDNSITL